MTAAEFRDTAAASGVRGGVAVQAADTPAEAEWLVGEAASIDLPLAIVFQYEATRAQTGEGGPWGGAMHTVLTRHETVTRGIRVATPGGAADLGDVRGLDGLAAGLTASGRVLELLVRPSHLPAVARLADRHPALQLVVCHLGLGHRPADETWHDGLAAIAARPNIAVKASGLIDDRDDSTLRGILTRAIDACGPGRVMFGSDWPISSRFVGYAEIVQRTASALPAMSADDHARFWHATARSCYGVGPS